MGAGSFARVFPTNAPHSVPLQLTIVCTDMSGFSRVTKEEGIVFFLANVKQMQGICLPIMRSRGGRLIKVVCAVVPHKILTRKGLGECLSWHVFSRGACSGRCLSASHEERSIPRSPQVKAGPVGLSSCGFDGMLTLWLTALPILPSPGTAPAGR